MTSLSERNQPKPHHFGFPSRPSKSRPKLPKSLPKGESDLVSPFAGNLLSAAIPSKHRCADAALMCFAVAPLPVCADERRPGTMPVACRPLRPADVQDITNGAATSAERRQP